jgi:hypothetical protein
MILAIFVGILGIGGFFLAYTVLKQPRSKGCCKYTSKDAAIVKERSTKMLMDQLIYSHSLLFDGLENGTKAFTNEVIIYDKRWMDLIDEADQFTESELRAVLEWFVKLREIEITIKKAQASGFAYSDAKLKLLHVEPIIKEIRTRYA